MSASVDENVVGRYQIVVIGKEGAVLLDTATGSSWSLARDIDTLQLGWRPLDHRWPSAVLHHAPERALPLPGEAPLSREAAGEASAGWWRPRRGAKWPRAMPMPTRPDRNCP